MNPHLLAIRQRIEHEDNLINQRLSWLVGSQSFLLTAFAITLNAPEKFHADYAAVHHRLLHLLPMVAIASILVLMLTLAGALKALSSLRALCQKYATADDVPIYSPTGVRVLGSSAAVFIPLLFLALWTALVLAL